MDGLKGLILAGRETDDEVSVLVGSPAAQTLPIGNCPLLHHALEGLREAGVTEVAIAVSRVTARAVEACVTGVPGVSVTYFEHSYPPNLVDAVSSAEDFLGGGPCVVYLGDSLVLDPLRPFIDEFEAGTGGALLLVRSGGDQGTAELDNHRLLRLVGSQPVPPSEEMLAGIYLLRPEAVAAASGLAKDPDAPQTIAGAMEKLIAAGGTMETRPVAESWKFSGGVDDLLEANRMVLDSMTANLIGCDLSRARIEGRVSMHPSAVLDGTTIRGPVSIGAGAVLVDTFVGPYTSIGENVRLDGAEIEHSIVLGGATIRHPGNRLEASLVGRDASITRDFAMPKSLRLRVGSHTEVRLS